MVTGVITSIQVVMVQSSVQPVIEELHRTDVDKPRNKNSFDVPPRQMRATGYVKSWRGRR